MIYIILAVLSSASISLLLRFGESKIENDFAMFMSNYIVCAILAGIFMKNMTFSGNGVGFAIGLGVLSGVFYLVSFMMLKFNIKKNGLVLAATFSKLGVLVPTVMAIVFYHEMPKGLQLLGIIGSIIAIIIINGGKVEGTSDRMIRLWLIVLLLVGGFTDSLANIYEKNGEALLKDQYLFFIFVTSAILCLIFIVAQKHKPTKAELIWGAAIGVPNYFSARFLLSALGELPAIIVYPAYNIATILIISMVGIGVLKEKMDKRKLIGMAIILVSLVLLNI